MQPKRTRSRWTEEQVGRLKRLHAIGYTFSELAEETGHPKNACITKALALNLPSRNHAEQVSRGRQRQMMAWSTPVDRLMEGAHV